MQTPGTTSLPVVQTPGLELMTASPELPTNAATKPQLLDPNVPAFKPLVSSLSRSSAVANNLSEAWNVVQHISAGNMSSPAGYLVVEKWAAGIGPVRPITGCKSARLKEDLLPLLPFMDDPELSALKAPARPVIRSSTLPTVEVKIPDAVFVDRALPAPNAELLPHPQFSPDYFVALGNLVSASGFDKAGLCYPAGTPNFLGARIPLTHTSLKIERWRQLLIGYEHVDLIDHLEYGFPLGLKELPEVETCTRNHGSSYSFFPHIDKFVSNEIQSAGLTGPFLEAPWPDLVCAPLMTAAKKPDGRRAVYDATYGEKSLNNATPTDVYLGQPCVYTFPKINDFRLMILHCGKDSYMFKRDLHRYYLQLPLCPSEYHRVAFVWRCLIFIFIALMFGLRHSGLQGQRTTDAVAWIHRQSGLESPEQKPFNICNYSDDLGGVEQSLEHAQRSFLGLASLYQDLGLAESTSKASPPSRKMVFLGIHFDTEKMEMSVPVDKLTELKAEIEKWARKTTITKREMQSLLGRMFWVAKVVRFSRIFMGRLLSQLRDLSGTKDHTKVKLEEQSRKDLLWWSRFLRTYNGVSMILNEDALPLSLEQMLDTPAKVCAGDATLTGIGAWHAHEYWSKLVPNHLKGSAIHILEFWAIIVSCKLWGHTWEGQVIQIFTDNDPVADVITHEKPRDPAMLSLLREFIFIVCKFKFVPVLRKISSADNFLADHISRSFDHEAASSIFTENGLRDMRLITAPDTFFKLIEPW